ncbi:MAG: hypothetical protein RSE93_04120 [Oscillospiraceae bacterium]
MSFGFIPFPIYIALCIIGSIYFLFIAVKRRHVDRKGLIIFYVTLSIGTIVIVILKILEKSTNLYQLFPNGFLYTALLYLAIILIELFYISITNKNNKTINIRIWLIWGLIFISILACVLIFIILD